MTITSISKTLLAGFAAVALALFPLAAQRALAQTESGELVAVVQLYRALGGGWQVPANSDEQEKSKGPRSSEKPKPTR